MGRRYRRSITPVRHLLMPLPYSRGYKFQAPKARQRRTTTAAIKRPNALWCAAKATVAAGFGSFCNGQITLTARLLTPSSTTFGRSRAYRPIYLRA
jgi:hypothetical protein